MKTALVTASPQSSAATASAGGDSLTMESPRRSETHVARSEASRVYDLQVLICRVGESETRARAANLPLPESRSATVREALQTIIEAARQLINDCNAHDAAVPWIVPPALPEENESRFTVPLVI